MNYLKSKAALITILLFLAGSLQTHAQLTPSEQGVKDIQKVLDEMEALKKAGKDPDDPAIKELAKKAIHMADSAYKIPAGNSSGEPEYDPDSGGDGESTKDGKKVKVTIGRGGFSSPGWLASTKLHEMVAHGGQAADGRWYNDAKGTEINEVEAYDAELADSTKNGLSQDEIAELKKRRKEHYDALDEADQKKIDEEKKDGKPYKLPVVAPPGKKKIAYSGNQQYFIAGTVLSEERMLVSVIGGKSIEGNVFTAEINGNKTEARTNANGDAILDFSAISAGVVGTAEAIIKTFDSKGNELNSTTTTVQQGTCAVSSRPIVAQLPDNLGSGDMVTIHGQNLGAETHLVLGDQMQETLSASDKELTVFCQSATGKQPAFVVTANGVSQSQDVNIFSIDIILPKSSITPKEVVIAQVHYESIPIGTKLIFTNISPETIKMVITGGETKGDQCSYTVNEPNGSIPINITGRTRGNFRISMNPEFKNGNHTPR
ncbi:MAG: hypothetical protein ACRDEB_10130 [Chitinophagaceae bacterium]